MVCRWRTVRADELIGEFLNPPADRLAHAARVPIMADYDHFKQTNDRIVAPGCTANSAPLLAERFRLITAERGGPS
jgi:hypothetical protein